MNLDKKDWILTKWLPEDPKVGAKLCRLNYRDQIVTNDGSNPCEYDVICIIGDHAWVVEGDQARVAQKVPKNELFYFELKKQPVATKPNTEIPQYEFVQWEDTPENKERQVYLEDRDEMVPVTVIARHNRAVFFFRNAETHRAEVAGLGWMKVPKVKDKVKPNTVDFRKIRSEHLYIRPKGTRIVCTVICRAYDFMIYTGPLSKLRETFIKDIHNFELAFSCQGPWMDFETIKNNPHVYNEQAPVDR